MHCLVRPAQAFITGFALTAERIGACRISNRKAEQITLMAIATGLQNKLLLITLICKIKSRMCHYFCRTNYLPNFRRTFFPPNSTLNSSARIFHPICSAESAAALQSFCHRVCKFEKNVILVIISSLKKKVKLSSKIIRLIIY